MCGFIQGPHMKAAIPATSPHLSPPQSCPMASLGSLSDPSASYPRTVLNLALYPPPSPCLDFSPLPAATKSQHAMPKLHLLPPWRLPCAPHERQDVGGHEPRYEYKRVHTHPMRVRASAQVQHIQAHIQYILIQHILHLRDACDRLIETRAQ